MLPGTLSGLLRASEASRWSGAQRNAMAPNAGCGGGAGRRASPRPSRRCSRGFRSPGVVNGVAPPRALVKR
eukprot:3206784-Lingulodinium_polyedra.AAC.1